MRRFRFRPHLALVIALGVMNGGCILIPELKDRLVELALSGTTSAVFAVLGSTTVVDETEVINVGVELDLATILADAGIIDVSNVTNIALSGVSYRITRADPNAAQTITNGTITIQRGAGSVDPLVTAFTAAPGVVSGFINVPLDATGVATVNLLLDDIVAALPGAPANPTATFHLTGSALSATDFEFELKITISITGTVEVRVPS